MKNFIFLLVVAFCSFGSNQTASAQSKTLNDVTRFNPTYFNAIKDNNRQVVGYYIFFKTDRAPKGMADFLLNIYDTEFNKVISKKMTEPKLTRLLSANGNGSSILFRFFNPKEYKIKYKGYDFEGNLVISKGRTITDKTEKSMMAKPNVFADYTGVAAIPGYGYAEYTTRKLEKLNYQIKYYPEEKGIKSWSKTGKKNLVEMAQRITAVDDLLISLVYSREKLMSAKDMEMHVVAHNVVTGAKSFDINLNKFKHNTIIIGGQKDPESDNLILYGLDYPEDKKVSKKSRGLLKLTISKSGELLDSKSLNWEKDFNFKNEDGKDFGNLHIHEFYPGANGHTFIVAEQISLNGGLTALSMIGGGGGGSTSFKIDDLVIIEVDKEFKVVHTEVAQKSRNNFSIAGIPLGSITAIGMMAEAYGYFDFAYLQSKSKPGEFTVGYVDWERRAGEKNGFAFNGITYADGKYTTDKINMTKKKTDVYVRESKPGFVSIIEYNKKEKTLDFRLEKINF